MRIELLRGIFLAGQPHEAGARLDVPDNFGRELIASNKARPAEAVPSAEPLTTDAATPVVRGKKAEA